MTPIETHLTEDERQSFADDTLPAEQRASADAHLAACQSCAETSLASRL
jgi:anti-sigma factor RsiW